ncbi:MAG: DNA-protecting protein DprA [Candidatus Moranbacteria bacterium]|nr:DNA-protecting protein DprA [Candidatus Moranbacteria bacterium]
MKYLHALNKINGLGPQKMRLLLGFFGSYERAWKADVSELSRVKLGGSLAEKIGIERKKIDPENEWEKLLLENIILLSPDSPDYPDLLKKIHNPPHAIYMRGATNLNSFHMISVVGSRNMTAYGLDAAARLSKELAESGFSVVSGLALGIDAAAHKAALQASGHTVAVLGSGVDDMNIFPRANFSLAKEIIRSGGAVMSDYPPGTPASNTTFPARNRIIAGLSLGTLVIEAAEKSGALITAKHALEFNREVFSVPGSIFSPYSIGTNKLIKRGAKIAMDVGDILEEFEFKDIRKDAPAAQKNPENEEEKRILDALSIVPLHIDNLGKLTRLETATLSSTLSMLEIKGWIKNVGGQNYIIT